ncbi:uncharacterized protein LOC135812512 [Sycon ciliatum]|uniref:uncharacterized protein LOC135812512 n=1 Tax=Sycon ciliatum TaxID=27933 RepID=UPI0031F663C9
MVPLITNELRLTIIAHHWLRLKVTVSKSMFGGHCGIQLVGEEPYISVHYTASTTGEHTPTVDGSTVQPLPSMVTTVRTSTANPTQKDIQSEQTSQIADTAKSPTTTATPPQSSTFLPDPTRTIAATSTATTAAPPRSSNFLSGPIYTIAATSTATTAAPPRSSNFLSGPIRTIAATSTATTATPPQSSDFLSGPISTVATTKTSSSRPYPVVSTSVSTTASRPAIVSGNSNLNIILALSGVVIILLLVVVCLVHRKRRQSPERTLIHIDGSTELSTNHCRSETPARDHHHATGVDPGKVLSRDLLADNALRYEQAHDDGVIRVYAVCGPAAPIETPQPGEDRTVETKITSTQPSMHAYEYITTPPTDAGIEDMVNDYAELEVDTSPSDPSTVVASMFGPIPGMVHESDCASDTLHTKGESAATSTMNQSDTRFAEAPYSNLKFPALGKSFQDTSGEITPTTTALPPALPEEDHSNSLGDHNITSLRNRLPSEYLVPMDL